MLPMQFQAEVLVVAIIIFVIAQFSAVAHVFEYVACGVTWQVMRFS